MHPTSRPSTDQAGTQARGRRGRAAARTTAQVTAVVSAVAIALGGCAVGSETTSATVSVDTVTTGSTTLDADALWDASVVHDIAIEVDAATLQSAIDTYVDSGEKVWIEADVVIDGVRFESVGLKLKGNSSLRSASADSDAATLPWVIRLDKFVDGQTWDGWSELVVRGNSTATSLNEAVALGLLAETGLAAESAVASAFSINGGQSQLRLVVQNPDDEWATTELGDGTLLYKAQSSGTWDYVGDDPADYADAFEQQAGDDDLTPLIDFLQFVNESDDATFAAELGSHLDVEAFATYLAFQDLVNNTDDIDGPGNNSYLAYDPDTGLMTVVNWDLNLAFGASPTGGGGGRTGQGNGGQGNAAQGNGGQGRTPGQGGGGGASKGNVLAERFRDTPAFAALIDQAAAELQSSLIDSGVAAGIVDTWAATLTAQAGDLVTSDTVQSEADAIRSALGIQ